LRIPKSNKYANGEEEDRLRSGKGRASDVPQSAGNAGKKQKRKVDPLGKAEVAAVPGQGKPKPKKNKKKDWANKKKPEYNSEVMDQPCAIHTKKDEEGNLIYPKHTTRECRMLKHEMGKEASAEKDDDEEGEWDSEYPHVDKVLNMIFADVESKSRLKVINREVNLVAPDMA